MAVVVLANNPLNSIERRLYALDSGLLFCLRATVFRTQVAANAAVFSFYGRLLKSTARNQQVAASRSIPIRSGTRSVAGFLRGFLLTNRNAVSAGRAPGARRRSPRDYDENHVLPERPEPSRIVLKTGPARTRTEDQGIHSTPPFPEGVDYLFTPVGCGTLLPVIKRDSSAQVVSAPSGGVPPAWLRVAIGIASVKVSLNSSRPLRTLRCEGTIIDESPALTN